MGKRRTTVSVFHVPHHVDGELIGSFLLKYGEIVSIQCDEIHGTWFFDILLDKENFTNIPFFLEAGEERLPIIVAGRRPTCWNCSEIGHLTSECPQKKPTPNPKTRIGEHLGVEMAVKNTRPPTEETEEKKTREPWKIVVGKKTPDRLSLEKTREEAMLEKDPGAAKYVEIVN